MEHDGSVFLEVYNIGRNYEQKDSQSWKDITEPPGMQQLEDPPDDSMDCTALLAASLPASTALCLRG